MQAPKLLGKAHCYYAMVDDRYEQAYLRMYENDRNLQITLKEVLAIKAELDAEEKAKRAAEKAKKKAEKKKA